MIRPGPRAGQSSEPPASGDQRRSTDPAASPGLESIVGANLRRIRVRRGLSLERLAKLSGVSRAMLGQIELGKSVPSVNIVWKVAHALEVPFLALIASEPQEQRCVLRKSQLKTISSDDGRFFSRALFPLETPQRVQFYELWLAGHGVGGNGAYAPGTRANLVVTNGSVDLALTGERFRLNAGDAIGFDADVPQAFVNPAAEECRMYAVFSQLAEWA